VGGVLSLVLAKDSSGPDRRQVRVLFIVTAFPRSPGDVITPWLVETIHRLRDVGVEVEVLAPSYRGLRDQSVRGIRVHRFRYAPAVWEDLTHDQTAPDRLRDRPLYLALVPAYLMLGSIAAARLARRERFDVVHAFWPIPHAVLGLAAKRAGGIPLVSTFFGVELTWLRSPRSPLRPVLRRLVQRSDAVTAISSYTARLLRTLAPEARPVVIPFGATLELKEGVSGARPAGQRPYTVLFVGRLVERKGVPVLIDAVARLRVRGDVRLEIVGDGPLGDELRRQVADRGLGQFVRFHGLVSDEALTRHYQRCDVLVLPAIEDSKGDTEGLGVVLLEALAQGKPVIGSDLGGIPDIVLHDRTGLLVPAGDATALEAAIGRLMDDPALAANLAENGRRHVEARFSWASITRDLANLYASLANREGT
jgi:glycosyltransferase involved in cell wall biosynthesis